MTDNNYSIPKVTEVPPPAQDVVVHEYDGIQEYDNELPNWWLYTLYAAVVFAGIYWSGYHILRSYDQPREAYERELVAARAKDAERIKSSGIINAGTLAVLSKDPATRASGKAVFAQNCAVCHKADGSGLIGPNLTDRAWIHGGAPDKVFATINDGVAAKGMPAWGPQLGSDRTAAVAAYVVSIENTNVAGGKAAQGDVEP